MLRDPDDRACRRVDGSQLFLVGFLYGDASCPRAIDNGHHENAQTIP